MAETPTTTTTNAEIDHGDEKIEKKLLNTVHIDKTPKMAETTVTNLTETEKQPEHETLSPALAETEKQQEQEALPMAILHSSEPTELPAASAELHQCSTCPKPRDMRTRADFPTEESFKSFANACPSLIGQAPPKLPMSEMKQCSQCKGLLCPTHADIAEYFGEKYRPHKESFLMCGQCCWFAIG